VIAGDGVKVTVTVNVAPIVAFEVFTTEIDRWWQRGPQYRVAGRRPGTLVLEPHEGGRLFESYDGADGNRALHEAGRVVVWDPPHRLELDWRGGNFAPGEVTRVAVAFTDLGGRTRVDLVHTGFAALRPDHPVRHGEQTVAFIRRLGLWWGDLLTSFRELAAP
jgi:uncharacterized protein YndB with AHSA1/START domain